MSYGFETWLDLGFTTELDLAIKGRAVTIFYGFTPELDLAVNG